jgi:hypothetical protein
MEREEAELIVFERWSRVVEYSEGAPHAVAPTLTKEFDWGWIVHLVPTVPVRRGPDEYPYNGCEIACDRTNGNSTPVGTKGLHDALSYLMRHRTGS